MAITGNNTLSIRKKDLANQKSIAVGFKRTVFAHKASAGETGISIGNLVTPTELSGMGFTQPSFSEIASGQMKAFRNNVRIVSSSKGLLMDYMSYIIKSATEIEWVGFTADQNEIFVVEIDHNARTGMRVVDAAPLVATGVLAAGSQDFSVGMPFNINKYPSMQVGAVTVYEDGVQVYRNTGNATAAPGADGNYQEVDAGNGYGTLIRFNTVEAFDRNITVLSTGLLVEKPNESQLAEIEAVQGQVDRLVETVAVLAGVPETDFQAAPSQIQLKQFGDRVLAMEQNRARIDLPNTWTAVQALLGRTDGNPVPTGAIGEQIVVLNDASLRSLGNTQNTYLDVPAASWTLQPGIWMMVVSAVLQIDVVTGGGAGDGLMGFMTIRTAGNAFISETLVTTANLNLQRGFGSAPVVAMVNISTPTSYKLSGYLKTISAAVSVTGSLVRGDFTPTRVTAIRIG